MIPGSVNPLLLAADAAAPTGYQIQRSLRFNSSDSAYLSRTPASAGNRKTWTWAGWVKRSKLGTTQYLFDSCLSGSQSGGIRFESSDKLYLFQWPGSFPPNYELLTDAVFRDVSAWYHIVVSVDTTQATSTNRVRLYVNGTQITQFTGVGQPSQNFDTNINAAVAHSIGREQTGANQFFDGYLADVHFIDGQALTPSSFTEVSATTGQLIPKQYTGSFGTNGFWLKFSDNSAATATTLGKDYSGNSNNWTPNNLSVTAGAGNDSLVDTPTSYGTGTSGGDVRGNFCTWNPLTGNTYSASYKNGNLDFDSSVGADGLHVFSTFQLPSTGKWYWETVYSQGSGFVGINSNATLGNNTQLSTMKTYYSNGDIGGTGGNATWGVGDVIGAAYDADAGTLKFYKNGALQATTISSVGFSNGPWWAQLRQDRNCISSTNFGQRPFAYTAPSGFKALCDTNLPAPVVAKPSNTFDAITWTGNGSSQSITLPGGFSPDLVWLKQRDGAEWHGLFNTIVGATTRLFSNSTNAEATNAQTLTAFNSNGFSVGNTNEVNGSGKSYVAWCWDAGSSTVTNTQGSITSQVRANPSAGFSIVTWSTPVAAGTIGHGLNATPSLIITKDRGTNTSWFVYHASLGSGKYLELQTTNAQQTNATVYSTSPTSTTFSPGTGFIQSSGYSSTMVSYCFAPVAGYSSFGSYTGNGSADGPFVFCNFRPRWILIKKTDSITVNGNWLLWDTARGSYNVANQLLIPNLANAEDVNASYGIDVVSNGFKLRATGADYNNNSSVYIYAAFAENPFQYARAR